MPSPHQYSASNFEVKEVFSELESHVTISASVDPVSLQGSGDRKKRFKEALGEAIAQSTTRIFTGDVKVEIDWYVSEKRRYGTHIVADIDNIVKPLFDAATGKNGIMFDDNQVQQFAVSWLDVEVEGIRMEIRFQALSALDFVTRAGYQFVDFGSAGCWPLPHAEHEFQVVLLQGIASQIKARQGLLDDGIEPHIAESIMSSQRFFPKTAIQKSFPVRPITDFIQ